MAGWSGALVVVEAAGPGRGGGIVAVGVGRDGSGGREGKKEAASSTVVSRQSSVAADAAVRPCRAVVGRWAAVGVRAWGGRKSVAVGHAQGAPQREGVGRALLVACGSGLAA